MAIAELYGKLLATAGGVRNFYREQRRVNREEQTNRDSENRTYSMGALMSLQVRVHQYYLSKVILSDLSLKTYEIINKAVKDYKASPITLESLIVVS